MITRANVTAVFLAFAISMLNVGAQAEEVGDQTLIAAVKKKKKKRKKTYYSPPASREPWVGITGVVGYQYIGIGLGAEAWWNVRKGLQVGAQYTVTQAELTSKDRDDIFLREVLDTEMTTTTVFGRYFFDDAFNVTAGVATAELSGRYGFKSLSESTQDTFVPFDASLTLLQVSIGHQWRLVSGHTFAIDWIGVGTIVQDSVTVGTDSAASDGSTVQGRVAVLHEDNVPDHLRSQLRDQFIGYALMIRMGMEF